MNKKNILEQIKKKAKLDEGYRRDPRFLDALGFLVAKGFLRTNLPVPLTPNKRLRLDDVLWAGRHVEPRILEVLPAAVLRLKKHFDLNVEKHAGLARVVEQLRKRQESGDDFDGIPYSKIKVWAELPLQDGRVKKVSEKKITKTFRMRPETVTRLQEIAKKMGCTETEVLEKKLLAPQK